MISGGESEAAQSISASTVLASQIQDAVLQGRSKGNLVRAHASVRAPVQDTFRSALNEQFRSSAQFGRFQGRAVRGHGFTITRELQGEFLLPFRLYVLPDNDGRVTPVQSALRDAVRVDLLGKDDQSGLRCLADLLECLFEFVEVDGRVVAHDADRANLVERLVVLTADLLASQRDFANRFVGRAGDLELVEAAVVALDLVEYEHSVTEHSPNSRNRLNVSTSIH
ncbi:unnamed protein product [Xylocopa violacea]|uniref:Uncharacterized protein n=1 Tax=Xylocopa violacea TaxID=135666 RepID=A0ABP1PKL5_XYLVO